MNEDRFTRLDSENHPPKAPLLAQARDMWLDDPQRPFIVSIKDGRIISYGELFSISVRLARWLVDNGVGEGDRVVVAFDNHWMTYPFIFASILNKSVVVPINPELRPRELKSIFSDAKPRMCVTESAGNENIPSKMRQVPLFEIMEELEKPPGREHASDGDFEHCDDPALIIYTSGTTGQSKGVILSERNLAYNGAGISSFYGLTPDDTLLCVMPCYHMNALMITGISVFSAGASVVLSGRFDFTNAKLMPQTIERYKVSVLSLTPSIMAVALKIFDKKKSNGFSGVRFAFCGAAPLPDDLWGRFESRFGMPVHQGYGLTETTCWATMTSPGNNRQHGNVGVPVNCEVRIESPDAETPGEVAVRGPIVSEGYFGKKARGKDAWFRTGDLGYIDSGALVISGRIKDIIIRNGININPGDIDSELVRHPEVHESVTVGVADEIKGEAVFTAVTPENPGSPPDQAQLMRWIRGEISSSKHPDKIVVTPHIPKNPTGKVNKPELTAILDGSTARGVLAAFNTNKWVRYQAPEDGSVLRRIQRSVELREPISFLKYWGAGERRHISDIDRTAMERVRQMMERIGDSYAPGSGLVILMTDTHAALNGKRPQVYENYFGEIAEHATLLGFDTLFASELWAKSGLDMATVEKYVFTEEFDGIWSRLDIRDMLIGQAAKHSKSGREPEQAARLYFAACLLEGDVYAKSYPDSLFLTYNAREQDVLLPPLPKIHIHSYKPKVGEKPWFL